MATCRRQRKAYVSALLCFPVLVGMALFSSSSNVTAQDEVCLQKTINFETEGEIAVVSVSTVRVFRQSGKSSRRLAYDDSGPVLDHTYQNNSGYYSVLPGIFCNTTSGGMTELEIQEAYNPPKGSLCSLEFWYSMEGNNTGCLDVYAYEEINSSVIQVTHLWERCGNQFTGRYWKKAEITNVTTSPGFRTTLLFVLKCRLGVPQGEHGDIAVDDIKFTCHCPVTSSPTTQQKIAASSIPSARPNRSSIQSTVTMPPTTTSMPSESMTSLIKSPFSTTSPAPCPEPASTATSCNIKTLSPATASQTVTMTTTASQGSAASTMLPLIGIVSGASFFIFSIIIILIICRKCGYCKQRDKHVPFMENQKKKESVEEHLAVKCVMPCHDIVMEMEGKETDQNAGRSTPSNHEAERRVNVFTTEHKPTEDYYSYVDGNVGQSRGSSQPRTRSNGPYMTAGKREETVYQSLHSGYTELGKPEKTKYQGLMREFRNTDSHGHAATGKSLRCPGRVVNHSYLELIGTGPEVSTGEQRSSKTSSANGINNSNSCHSSQDDNSCHSSQDDNSTSANSRSTYTAPATTEKSVYQGLEMAGLTRWKESRQPQDIATIVSSQTHANAFENDRNLYTTPVAVEHSVYQGLGTTSETMAQKESCPSQLGQGTVTSQKSTSHVAGRDYIDLV